MHEPESIQEQQAEAPDLPQRSRRVDRLLAAAWASIVDQCRLQWTENKVGLGLAAAFLIGVAVLTLTAID